MKRILITICALLLLTGCAGQQQTFYVSEPPSGGASCEPCTLRVLYTESIAHCAPTIDSYAAWFEDRFPGIRVEVLTRAYDDLGGFARCLTEESDGQAVDVVLLSNSWVREALDSGWIADLSDDANLQAAFLNDELLPGVYEKCVYRDGTLFGVPAWMLYQGLACNTERFAVLGLTPPEADWTFADFEALAREAYRDDGDGIPECAVMALEGKGVSLSDAGWVAGALEVGGCPLWMYTERVDGGLRCDTPAMREYVTSLLSLYEAFPFYPLDRDSVNSFKAWYSTLLWPAYSVPPDEYKQMDGVWDGTIVAYPTPPVEGKGHSIWSGAYWCAGAESAHPDEARLFLSSWLDEDYQRANATMTPLFRGFSRYEKLVLPPGWERVVELETAAPPYWFELAGDTREMGVEFHALDIGLLAGELGADEYLDSINEVAARYDAY